MGLRKLISQIKKHDNFLITSHVNPESDALGSELGFYRLLKALGKNAVIINEEAAPSEYDFLPQVSAIKAYKDNLKGVKFDCFVALDCSDLKRTGEVYKLNTPTRPIINIDHHISNVKFGRSNWVCPEASSTSEMVYELFKAMKVEIDKDTAILLYTGILTDTGSFRFSNTTCKTHKVVADLMTHGLDVVELFKHSYGNLPFKDMKFIIKLLNGIKRSYQGKILWFEINKNTLKINKGLRVDLTDYLMNFARSIKDVEVAVLFRENFGIKNEVRVNFRSQGKIDVNKLAGFFGGGGHKSASGATLPGSLKEVRVKVLAKLKQTLKRSGL